MPCTRVSARIEFLTKVEFVSNSFGLTLCLPSFVRSDVRSFACIYAELQHWPSKCSSPYSVAVHFGLFFYFGPVSDCKHMQQQGDVTYRHFRKWTFSTDVWLRFDVPSNIEMWPNDSFNQVGDTVLRGDHSTDFCSPKDVILNRRTMT